MRTTLLWPLLLLTLGAAPAPECTVDTECTLMTRCACDCCPARLEAATTAAAKAERLRCSRLGPCGRVGCAADDCPPPEHARNFEAVCRAGKCTRQPRPRDAGVR